MNTAPWNWDQTAFDTACEAVYEDSERYDPILHEVAKARSEDDGEWVGTVLDAYGALKRLADGVTADQLKAKDADAFAALFRLASGLHDDVYRRVSDEVMGDAA